MSKKYISNWQTPSGREIHDIELEIHANRVVATWVDRRGVKRREEADGSSVEEAEATVRKVIENIENHYVGLSRQHDRRKLRGIGKRRDNGWSARTGQSRRGFGAWRRKRR